MADEETLRDYLKWTVTNLHETQQELREVRERSREPIAIVGMGCRLPGGVYGPEDLWELVAGGVDAVSPFPTDRGWEVGDADYARQGGFVHDATEFDAEFFGISPREALAMDPQQRLLLEVVWEALERAGLDPATLKGSRTGVFAGASTSGYASGFAGDSSGVEGYLMTGNAGSVISGRVSYALGLEGPAVTVDTACSSSLVALHLAVQALRNRECGLAVVGGVTVMATAGTFAEFSRQDGLSADGRCRSFSDDADGTGWSEGAGVLVVERLSDARRNGHRVLAVVTGSAVNQDGASNGLTAPNGPSQRRVIRAALDSAQLSAADVDVVEAHGTGTTLGDPIEARAVLETYGQSRSVPLWLGSIKSNIGHTQQAAGVTGVIKMVQALQHEMLPRTLHVAEPSTHVDWTVGNVQLLREPVPWPQSGQPDRPRRAGVSAFGMSGTNAHVIIEDAPAVSADTAEDSAEPVADAVPSVGLLPGAAEVPWLVSGRSVAAVSAQAGRLRDALDASVDPDAVAFSLATTRSSFRRRAVVVGSSSDELLSGLAAVATGQPASNIVSGVAAAGDRTVLVFPGQGSQWLGMGRELARSCPVFAARLAECGAALAPWVDWSLDEILSSDTVDFASAGVVQPVLWAVMVSLAAVWEAAGVVPSAVVGHSQGEIAAAVVAGVLSLEDGARVVALRSKALEALAGRGGMVSVAAPVETVHALIGDTGVSIAAVNGPSSTVVSGSPEALDALIRKAEIAEVRTRTIAVDYASHSAQVEELKQEIESVLQGITPQPAQLTMVSSRTGQSVEGPELDPAYWYASLRETVQFSDAIATLAAQGYQSFIECSPHPVLTGAITDTVAQNGETPVVVGTLRRDDGGPERLLTSLAEAWTNGLPIAWNRILPKAATVDLPTYAFQRQHYWPRIVPAEVADDCRYRVTWQQIEPGPKVTGNWLLIGDAPEVGDALRQAGVQLLTASLADLQDPADRPVLDGVVLVPSRDDSCLAETFTALRADLGAPLWVLTRGAIAAIENEPVPAPEQAQAWGFGRVAALEHPEQWGGLIDLPQDWSAETAEQLLTVLAGPEDQVALRPGAVLARRLQRAPLPVTRTDGWRTDGTALITGGTGAIGGQVARWLVSRGAPAVVLTSRTGPTAGVALAAELAASGANVEVMACDAAVRDDLAGLLHRVGPLTAVVHAAGIGDGAMVADTSAGELTEVTRVKVAGARNLDELAGELDAFVVFSSGAAVWGSGGLAGYAAGNAYLDALVESRRARGLAATSIAWGLWGGGGMVDGEVGAQLQRFGMRVLQPARGMREFGRILDADEPAIVVADVDWPLFIDTFTVRRASRLISSLPEATVPADSANTDDELGELARRLVRQPRSTQLRELTELVRAEASAVLGHSSAQAVEADRAFKELGFDSLTAVELRNRLHTATGLALPSTLIFDHPNANALGSALVERLFGPDGAAAATIMVAASDEPLAVVGMGCRYPGGASGPEKFWELVVAGTDAIAGFPVDRGWDLVEQSFGSEQVAAGEAYIRQGGFVYDAADFDAGFFGISPREALAMDPQQRMLLEVSWESLEDAGIDPRSLRGSSTGVFVGATYAGYGMGLAGADAGSEGYLLTGGLTAVISGRVAYSLGLEGPAVTVDTACSSSLVALHQAMQSLRSGECSMALAGGVAVLSTPGAFMEFSQQGGMATNGRCKAFGAGADGIGWGEGAGMIVLERLSDAQRNGHTVLAVIRGSAMNSDGASNGLSAPNGPSQQRVIRAALANAGLTAQDVDAVEAHGTGTSLGDPIEAQALLATYGQDRDEPLWLGSVKSNIGHTQTAAGVAGVIKMIQALRHEKLPRTLHADVPTPEVDWTEGRVQLLTENVPWPASDRPDRRRRAGVSAFGISGTNVHVILEEAPAADASVAEDAAEPLVASDLCVWPVSGRSGAGLAGQAGRLRERVIAEPGVDCTRIGWSLATTRSWFERRAVVLGSSREELTSGLAAVATGQPAPNVVSGVASSADRLVLVFPGQGSQWLGMGRELARSCPVFAARLAECGAALAPWTDWSLDEILSSDTVDFASAGVVQPVLWAVMVSLAAVWEAAGVTPAAVVGHSQGEIAAAVVAGVLSLEDGARVVALRSKALEALAGRGGMVSVAAPVSVVKNLIGDTDVSVAAVNGPSSTVVSGSPEALQALIDAAEQAEVRTRTIAVDYASHSAQVEELQTEIESVLQGIQPQAAQLTMVSSRTGRPVEGPELDPAYWYASLRETVQFSDAIATLAAQGYQSFIECSPHPVLTGAITDTITQADDNAETPVVVGTLRRDDGGPQRLLTSLAEAWTNGVPISWNTILPKAATVDLPTYAFQHKRYWPETGSERRTEDSRESEFWAALERGDIGSLARDLGVTDEALADVLPALTSWRDRSLEDAEVSNWRYRIAWTPVADPGTTLLSGRWVVLAPSAEAATDSARTLEDHGAQVDVVITDATDRATLAQELPRHDLDGVLSLLALDETTLDGRPSMSAGLTATLTAVQALGDAGIDAPLWVLTRGAVTTGPDEPAVSVLQAPVWGLGRAVGLEHAERWGGLIDLPADQPWDDVIGGRLCAALAGSEDQVAIRRPGLLARRLVRSTTRTGPGTRWQPRGTVLLTGGTGSIGALVGGWLAGREAPRVVLTSRSGPSAPGVAEAVAQVAAAGTQVDVLCCDMAERDQVAGLLDDIDADGPPLCAVLHSANAAYLARLEDTTVEGLGMSMGAKATGAMYLDELTADLDLDAFVLFSSISATWGSNDHGAYAAGNAYLDALAEDRRNRGLPGTSIAWGVWDTRDWSVVDAGLDQARPGSVTPARLLRQGINFLDPDRALTGLGQVLDDDETFLALADVEWERFAPVFRAKRDRPLLDLIADAREPEQAEEAVSDTGELAAQLAGLTAEQRLPVVVELVRKHAAAVLGFETVAELPATRAFRDLGFDSLTAVDLRNRIAAASGLSLPATVVFDYPNATALATFVCDRLGGPSSGYEATLDEVDRLAAALDDADETARAQIAARLDALARRFRARSVEPAADQHDELSSASADEMFDLLENELNGNDFD